MVKLRINQKLLLQCTLIIVMLIPISVFSSTGRELVNEGNKLFLTKDPKKQSEALEKYLEAREKRSERMEIPFNIGTSYSNLNRFEEAQNWLIEASKSPNSQIKADAHYQLGNLLFKQKQYDKAIQQYAQSLKHAPGDTSTRKNLELAYWLSRQPPPDSTQNEQQKQSESDENQEQQEDKKQQDQQDKMLEKAQQKEAETQKKLLKKRNEGERAYPASGKDW